MALSWLILFVTWRCYFSLIFLWFIYQNVSNSLELWNYTCRYEILHTLNLCCTFIPEHAWKPILSKIVVLSFQNMHGSPFLIKQVSAIYWRSPITITLLISHKTIHTCILFWNKKKYFTMNRLVYRYFTVRSLVLWLWIGLYTGISLFALLYFDYE
jgi:hypothetical protein